MSRLILATLSVVALLVSVATAWSPRRADLRVLPPCAIATPDAVRQIFDRGDRTLAETLSVLAHNLTNADTTAFKARYVVAEAVDPAAGGGTRHVVRTDFRQGDLLDTERPLDLAIFGRGFYPVMDDMGTMRYTRRGDFTPNAHSTIVLRIDGREWMLDAPIMIPPDATQIHVDNEGIVSVEQSGRCEKLQVGQMQLALFVNVDGLKDVGGGLYEETEDSGIPEYTNPAIAGAGKICQRNREASNVDIERNWREYEKALTRLNQFRAAMASAP